MPNGVALFFLGGVRRMAGMSLGEIESKIKFAVKQALQGVCTDYLKEDLAIRASSDVYGAYSPRIYVRRFTLENEAYYQSENMGDMRVGVTPIAPFNRLYGGNNYGNELAGLMNYGAGWHGYAFDYDAPNPRPYLDNVVNEWSGGKFANTMADALRARGFDVK